MTDKSRTFCSAIHDRLLTLDSHVRELTLTAGPTWKSLQERLNDIRRKSAARLPALQEARGRLQQWSKDKESESQNTIAAWRTARETRKLAIRAQRAEDHAVYAIEMVEASIDDAERMILEAISARLDESTGRESAPDFPNWYVYRGDSRR